MVASSACLAVSGILCLFLPDEVLSWLGTTGGGALSVQLLGGLYLGAAAANWSARGAMIGGIYARPLSLGNFVHFLTGTLAVVGQLQGGTAGARVVALAAVYALFFILFALLLYGKLGQPAQ